MLDNLVIVESKSKIKTFQKILGPKFTIIATGGHICNLPKKTLGIETENDFHVTYVPLSDKKKKIIELREKIKQSKIIWLATDKDYEGERIAENIKKLCLLKNFNRVYFTEITPTAIKTSFENCKTQLNQKFLDCQETRRVIDRLVGYKITPFLWKKFPDSFKMKLSIGRVQSATMSLLMDRERTIKEFQSMKQWKMKALFKHDLIDSIDTMFYQNDLVKIWESEEILPFLHKLSNQFIIICGDSMIKKSYPPKPFITSSLQQTAYGELGFTIGKTMKIAQELYEKGHITYLRTDSHVLSQDFIAMASEFLVKKYGKEFLETFDKKIVNKKNAQEAHEAIRPTKVDFIISNIPEDAQKLYRLIWIRTMSFLLQPYIYEELPLYIKELQFEQDQYFRGSFQNTVSLGYKVIFEENGKEKMDMIQFSKKLHGTKVHNVYIEAYESKQEPPKYYDEASLVKMMENKGIGRPATYQISIEKLMNKNYIEKCNIKGQEQICKIIRWENHNIIMKDKKIIMGKQNNKFKITQLGHEIYEFVNEYFPFICNIEFTKKMEENIDDILSSTNTKNSVLTLFYETLKPLLNQEISKNSSNDKISQFKIHKKTFHVKNGKFGYYIQFMDKKKTKNIPLQPYLDLFKKSIEEIQEDDIKKLLKFPLVYQKNSQSLKIEYGRYGIYCRDVKIDNDDLQCIKNYIEIKIDK